VKMRTTVAAIVVAMLVAGTVAAILVAVRREPEIRPVRLEQALGGFVRNRFDAAYIGECPQELGPDGEVPMGICSIAFERTGDRAVYGVGPPFSEFLGEVSLARDPAGSWSVTGFRPIPPPDVP
jgi:hypothetical protein